MSPKPGKIDVLERRRVEYLIGRQNYLSDTVKIDCPEKVFVKRLSQTISKARIRQMMEQALAKSFPGKEYRLLGLDVRGLNPYPEGNLTLRLDKKEDIVNRRGRLSCYLNVLVDGKKYDRLPVTGTAAVYETVVFYLP